MGYFQSKEVLHDEDKGLDLRKLKADGFVGASKVIVWWAEDDEDTGPIHGKWVADFFEGETRMFSKPCGHEGACSFYMGEFLEALVKDTEPGRLAWPPKLKTDTE